MIQCVPRWLPAYFNSSYKKLLWESSNGAHHLATLIIAQITHALGHQVVTCFYASGILSVNIVDRGIQSTTEENNWISLPFFFFFLRKKKPVLCERQSA